MNSIFHKLKIRQFITIILSLLEIICSVVSIYIMQELIDNVSMNKFEEAIICLKILVIVVICYFILIFLSQYSIRTLQFLGKFSLIKELYDRFLRKDLIFYNKNNRGELLSKITNDSQKIADWYVQGKVFIVIQTFSLVVVGILMLKYSVVITVIMIVIISICFYIVKKLSRLLSEYMKEDQRYVALMNQYILESVDGFFDIKQLRREDYFSNIFNDNILRKRIETNTKISRYFSLYVSIATTVAFVLPIFAFILAVFFILKDEGTLGGAFALYTLTKMLDEPIRGITAQVTTLETAKKMEHRLSDLVEDGEKQCKSKLSRFESIEMTLEHFKFNKTSEKILENLNLHLKQGEVLIVKGKSGVGKTTLSNIFFNNFESSDYELKGSIRLNSEKIRSDNISCNILKATQEATIFELSMRENILLGNRELEERLSEIIELLELNEVVDEKGFDTILSEDGDNLSGGQKHRLHLARALIRRPEFIILDEPTSALNKKLSEKISKNIIDYIRKYNMTSLIITHSNDFDNYADEILEL